VGAPTPCAVSSRVPRPHRLLLRRGAVTHRRPYLQQGMIGGPCREILPQVRALIRALHYTKRRSAEQTQPWIVRSWTVDALADLGDPRAVAPLRGVLARESEDSAVRRDAIKALARFGDAASIPLLLRALSLPSLQEEAARALRDLGWKPTADLDGARYWAALEEWNECVGLGDLAVEPFIDRLEPGGHPAARALSRLGAAAIEPLAERALEELTRYCALALSVRHLDFRSGRDRAVSGAMDEHGDAVYAYFRPFGVRVEDDEALTAEDRLAWRGPRVRETVGRACEMLEQVEEIHGELHARFLGVGTLLFHLKGIQRDLDPGAHHG